MLNSKTNIIPMDDYDSNITDNMVSSSPQISCSRAIYRYNLPQGSGGKSRRD
jgi:hypothetical protein